MENKYVDESKIFNIFNNSINKCGMEHKSKEFGIYKSIATENKKVILDILKYNDSYIFGSLGNIKRRLNLARIRNLENLSFEHLRLDPGDALEEYTYFLIDCQTGIISFINSRSAPSIKFLSNVLQENQTSYNVSIYPIRNHNVEGLINGITKYGALEIKLARPPAEVLGKKGENAHQRLIHKVAQQGFQKFSIRFITDNNQEQDVDFLNSIVTDIYRYAQKDKSFEKIDVKANFDGQVQNTVNLLELYFTRSIRIIIDENFTESNIYELLMQVYNKLKNELLKNVVLHSKKDD